ncbi:MAG: hypothetical protein ACLFWF_04930 [Alphaproteobacteria bacterium]
MTVLADLILIAFFGYLCWWLTDGFRRNVAVMVPLLLVAFLIRFAVLPRIAAALFAGQ